MKTKSEKTAKKRTEKQRRQNDPEWHSDINVQE
jgi:hypothetical protein